MPAPTHHKWQKLLESKRFKPADFPEHDGEEITVAYLKTYGFEKPIIVRGADGLDMTMPPSNVTVCDIAEAVGT
jgi:hypothetical protein